MAGASKIQAGGVRPSIPKDDFKPRSQLLDIKVSDKLSLHAESKEESGTRRVLFSEPGGAKSSIELSKGAGFDRQIAGHQVSVDGPNLFIDGARVDFDSGNLIRKQAKAKPKAKPKADEFAGTKKTKEQRQTQGDRINKLKSKLKDAEASNAEALLETMRFSLDEAKSFKPKTPQESREKTRIVKRLEAAVVKGEDAAGRLQSAKDPGTKADAMFDLQIATEQSKKAIGELGLMVIGQRAGPPVEMAGIDPARFRAFVETTLLQMQGGPQVYAPQPGRAPTYTEALMQMHMGDLNRVYQPQATGYPPQMQQYGGQQMPPYLFGQQTDHGHYGPPPPQAPQKKPWGWGKIAMAGAAVLGVGSMLTMGMGPFGMGGFGMGMPLLQMGLGSFMGGTIMNPLGGFNMFAF